ncbi:MAG TPA: PKD domain-containing protein [Verrucomicrobiae bacterium]|nr:PKD domain-containing protein [Verrucomicrobiae bacterium]
MNYLNPHTNLNLFMMTKLLLDRRGSFRPKAGKFTVIGAALLLMALSAPAPVSAQTNAPSTLTVRATGGQFRLVLHGQPNQVYEIEASTNMTHWAGIAQRSSDNYGRLIITNSLADQTGHFPVRFYRAVQPGAFLSSTGLTQDLTGLGQDDYVPDRILVKPLAGVKLSGLNLSLGVSVLNVFPTLGNLQVIKVPPLMTSSTLIALYQQSGLVQYAEHDFYVHALASPNDFYYQQGNLWGLHNYGQFGGKTNADIDAPDAWSVQHDASNIIVAVVDTGVYYTHEDLAGNMWHNPQENQDGYTNDLYGINVTTNGLGNGNPLDDYGHGTHVAGTIGAVGNNTVGVVGVAWHVQIMACKFLDSTGNGTIDGAIQCLQFAQSHGANIVNASWGSTGFTSQALHDAIASLRNAGIMFVAAAGNSGADNDVTPLYPASYSDLDNVIAVAATDSSDQLPLWSDYGATNVDLATPGQEIYSCWNGSNSDYQFDDGTSMACAMTAGAIAVMEAHFPNDNYQQIKQQVLANVDPLPSLQGKCISGGRLNLYKALTDGAAPPPTLTASFAANPTSGQAPLNVQFTDTSSGSPTSWNWNFGDGTTSTTQNPSHTFNNTGNFTVTLTVANGSGQTSSGSQTISVTSTSSAPVITLTATQPDAYFNGQVPGTINFHRTGDTSQSYQVNWTFSGTAVNGVDFQQLPTNSPFPAGQSDAALAITPINHGQTSDKTVIVTLAPGSAYQAGSPSSATVTIHASVTNAAPTASFTANPTSGQAPLTVQFTDTSSGNPVSWNWNFGDGSTSTTQNPSHTFNSAGNFTVTLTVANSSNQTSSASQTISVTNASASVRASFSANPSSGQAPLPVQFTDQSSGPVTSWNWNFGDGSTSTTQSPSHTYNSAGSFTATLTVTGSSGQTSSASHTITVTNAPAPVTASFSANPSSGQAPLPVQFTDTSSGNPTSWNWNFGDGSTSTTQNPSHTYNSAGSFTATLTVTGSGGQTSSVSHTITVTNAPPQPVTANFSANPSSGQAPLAVQFTDQSSGPVTSWSWNFGDGSTSTTQNPSHTYSGAGSFSATLTVTGSSGQTSSVSHSITVTNAPPPPSATVTVAATQPLATSLTPGVFTVTRTGNTSSQLTIYYSLGGTAQNGVDYQSLSGSVVFPAGSSTTSVVVQPLGLLKVLKTVGLTISPNASYSVGSPNSATVTIVASLQL